MTEEGANEELFSIIIVSDSAWPLNHICIGLADGLGRQDAKGMRLLLY